VRGAQPELPAPRFSERSGGGKRKNVVDFQGPMPAHHPGMTTHYDLHVWLWKHNPTGMFAEWNPNVRCP
jgi:hypothetical protein